MYVSVQEYEAGVPPLSALVTLQLERYGLLLHSAPLESQVPPVLQVGGFVQPSVPAILKEDVISDWLEIFSNKSPAV